MRVGEEIVVKTETIAQSRDLLDATLKPMKDAYGFQCVGRIGTPHHTNLPGAGKLKSNIDVVCTAKPGSVLLAYLCKIVPYFLGQFAVNTTHLLKCDVSRSEIILDLLTGSAGSEAF